MPNRRSFLRVLGGGAFATAIPATSQALEPLTIAVAVGTFLAKGALQQVGGMTVDRWLGTPSMTDLRGSLDNLRAQLGDGLDGIAKRELTLAKGISDIDVRIGLISAQLNDLSNYVHGAVDELRYYFDKSIERQISDNEIIKIGAALSACWSKYNEYRHLGRAPGRIQLLENCDSSISEIVPLALSFEGAFNVAFAAIALKHIVRHSLYKVSSDLGYLKSAVFDYKSHSSILSKNKTKLAFLQADRRVNWGVSCLPLPNGKGVCEISGNYVDDGQNYRVGMSNVQVSGASTYIHRELLIPLCVINEDAMKFVALANRQFMLSNAVVRQFASLSGVGLRGILPNISGEPYFDKNGKIDFDYDFSENELKLSTGQKYYAIIPMYWKK